jgi:hypothetical protein
MQQFSEAGQQPPKATGFSICVLVILVDQFLPVPTAQRL